MRGGCARMCPRAMPRHPESPIQIGRLGAALVMLSAAPSVGFRRMGFQPPMPTYPHLSDDAEASDELGIRPSEDPACERWQVSQARAIRRLCAVRGPIECVYALAGERCGAADFCSGTNPACGFVARNRWVRVQSYSCDFATGGLLGVRYVRTARCSLRSKPALYLIMFGGVFVWLACYACCCCHRSCRRHPCTCSCLRRRRQGNSDGNS
mmetsp:Transcript_53572/g.150541  ORF Transcript_53572/g.150541 Transcript_53572/m.150541 type:complete len:210 (+) Transcript_53572:30-659(+)